MPPFDKQHNQRVHHLLAERGIELTLDQITQRRKEALATSRPLFLIPSAAVIHSLSQAAPKHPMPQHFRTL